MLTNVAKMEATLPRKLPVLMTAYMKTHNLTAANLDPLAASI